MAYAPALHPDDIPEAVVRRVTELVARGDLRVCIEHPYNHPYPRIVYPKGRGARRGRMRAHRASYALYRGLIPAGFVVCHTCDNPRCINPRHLWLGTQKENIADAISKGRMSRLVPWQKHRKRRSDKLSEHHVQAILADPRNNTEVAAAYGISNNHVSQIRSGKRWAWIKRAA